MNCTCHNNSQQRLTINGVLRGDPTRTFTLRRAFEAQMLKRFAVIKRAIIQAVDTDDVFGLRERRPTTLQELQPRQFEFLRSDQKVKGFMDWLKEMEKKHILTVTYQPGVHQGDQPWTNYYIQSAYQRGMNRARQELRKKGYNVPRGEGPLRQDSIGVAFNQPFHAERVAMVYTRVYSELDGITSAMDQQISRVLALGMAEGKNPYTIARDITGRVDAIGLNRARTLARTEVVSAHHQATINEYEQWGVHGVSVQAEWMTAGFGVCPTCQQLERGGDISPGIYSLNTIRNMIPAHPNCRCCALPIQRDIEAAAPIRTAPTTIFEPAATLNDAQERVSGLFNMQDVHFKGESFTNAAKLSMVNELGLELQRLENSFPGLSKLTTKPESAGILPGRKLQVIISDRNLGEYTARLNEMEVSPIIRTGKVPSLGETYSWHSVYDDDLYVFRHEYAHAIHQQGLSQTEFEEWFSIYKGKTVDFWEKTVSEYGGSSASELFAESFSEYTSTAYKSGTLTEEIEGFFEKVLNR